MRSTSYAFIAICLMALVTYIPRVLPVTLFRKKITSPFIRSFLNYVPYAVLGAMTFPAIFYSTGNTMTAICGTIVALALAMYNQGLVVVAIGAIITTYVTSYFF
ncbi:MAG: AzlD domain-containing protein [Lachnospiraceae bacterium]|nr:AzlD domain-containing protein [Lachnospiraceae bacterium]